MFKIGDKVTEIGRYEILTVVGVSEKYIWLKDSNGSHFTDHSRKYTLSIIKIGDKVRVINGSGAEYTVIGKHEDDLWVLTTNGAVKITFKESTVEKI